MRLTVCGLNHQTAPLHIREKLAFNTTNAPELLHDLLKSYAVNEAVLLSTCNRTEIYTVAPPSLNILAWLNAQARSDTNVNTFCYQHEDIEMVRHAMRVAGGLDSMILGESQVLNQMKQAYAVACDSGTVGEQFKKLFPAIFSVSKQIRTQTAIGENPISIAYAVTQLAKKLFSHLPKSRVLLIGAGETISLMATHLVSQDVQQLIIANRTLTHAENIAQPFNAKAIRMAEIPSVLKDVDIVITATTSQLPILGKGAIESALRQRKHRPMLLVDLAVPRDIEPEVSQLEDVYLYNLDDIQTIVEKNRVHRENAAKQAETIVDIQAAHYFRHLRLLKVSDIIRKFREQHETLRDQELEKALMYWQKTNDPQTALTFLARNLTNKWLHQPTIKLREAAYDERTELLWLIQELFNL